MQQKKAQCSSFTNENVPKYHFDMQSQCEIQTNTTEIHVIETEMCNGTGLVEFRHMHTSSYTTSLDKLLGTWERLVQFRCKLV